MQLLEANKINSYVVLNDEATTPVTTNLPVQPSVHPTLTEMEAKRQQWEITAYRTSNQQLYAVLADCLAYGATLPFAAAKMREKELEQFLASRGYVVKKDSPLLTRIVKAVFGNVDRRRISSYSLVLRTAQKAGITAYELADWIEQCGGIQEVRLARSANYVSPKSKAAQARSTLSSLQNLATAKGKLAEQADAEYLGSECVLLAEQLADGSFGIKALIRSSGVVNAALAALYSEQKKSAA